MFDKIGEGKFGKVYKACKQTKYNLAVRDYVSMNHDDTELRHFNLVDFLTSDQIYACKRLKLTFQSVEEEKVHIQEFENEAKTLQRLDSKHVVRLLGTA